MKHGLLLFMLLVTFPLSTHAQTFHLLLVADQGKTDLGMVSIVDQEKISDLAQNAAAGIGYELKTTYLNTTNFSTLRVSTTLQALKPAADDIVFFYYTGKGYYPAQSKSPFPFLAINDYQKQPLSLDKVGEVLRGKGNRFSIIMADCRDSIYYDEQIAGSFGLNENISHLIYKKMFLEPVGQVIVASGGRGQRVLAFGNEVGSGSIFTEKLTRTLHFIVVGARFQSLRDLSWKNIFTDIEKDFRSVSDTDRTQVPVWTVKEYQPARSRRIPKMPTYRHSLTALEVQRELKSLSEQKDKKEQAKTSSRISPAFQKNATIRLFREYYDPKQKIITKRETKTLNLDRYLIEAMQAGTRISNVHVDAFSVKRTANFEHIISADIYEEVLVH